MDEYDYKKIRLKALDIKDVKVISYLCQDAIFNNEEMIHLKNDNKFVMTFTRFCWEINKKDKVFFRVVSAMQINNILNISFNKFKIKNLGEFVNLLSISYKKNFLYFHFSQKKVIKINVKNIDILLEDIDLPWPTFKKPTHK